MAAPFLLFWAFVAIVIAVIALFLGPVALALALALRNAAAIAVPPS